ncbi:hypothetical protein BGZ72_001954 [Mortierella alpina]|nr:hypothetical protein BGZ72_001954 [Mortierella alpina]
MYKKKHKPTAALAASPSYQTSTTNITISQTLKQANTPSAMSIFKRSNKNKSASAASTPAQTPRSSMQEQRSAQATKMTREEALEMLMQKSLINPTTGPCIR